MSDALRALKNYFAELGADAELIPDEDVKRRLPLFLGQLYEPMRATVFGRPMHLMVAVKGQHPTPAELETHSKLVGRHLGPDVAFVLDGLPSYARNRLLKRRIPFIVPNRQMFLPGVIIDLREVHGEPTHQEPGVPLSMPAQLLLLRHLQNHIGHQPLALHEWAADLQYSKMSMTRAHRELLNAGLVEEAPPGKTVAVRFAAEGCALWERALPLLRNPIQKEGHFRLRNAHPEWGFDAGLTALAHYTDLAEGPERMLAIWRLSKTQTEAEPVPDRDTGTVVIQRWRYSPAILADDRRTVDRLSLYLSLRDSADERIQSALSRMLEGVKW